MTPERFSGGSKELDMILGGGLPACSTTILAGWPGTGKTVLAQQILFANASDENRALYLTTLSEPLEKMVRHAQTLSYFNPDMLPGPVHYQDIGQAIRRQGVGALPAIVEEILTAHPATFLVIDSFKAFHDLSTDQVALRGASSIWPVSSPRPASPPCCWVNTGPRTSTAFPSSPSPTA